MAAPVFLSSRSDAREVCIVPRATKEVVIVSPTYPNAQAVRVVSPGIRGVIPIQIGNENDIDPRELFFAYVDKIVATEPIAYWPQNELSGFNALDASGNGRNGSYQGGVTLGADGVGDNYSSAQYNGSNGCCNVFSSSLAGAFTPAKFTIATWLRILTAGVWTDGTNDCAMHIGVDTTANFVRFLKTSTNNQFQWTLISGGTTKTITKSTFSPLTWFHVAITVDLAAGQMRAYLNGAQEGATQTSLGTWAGTIATARCQIGAQTTVPALPWNGRIAHSALWNRVLSPSEIASIASLSTS